ncbi:hypothetical protein [Kitasatospora sp. NPDC059599]|uniref:hypothetical protein n=1 Tax=Kitasatospora sp. NPDC059599 TaxID=3346880 RepID=UPI0036C399B1
MSSCLRIIARLVTALAVTAAYVALQLAIDVGIDGAGGREGSGLEAAVARWLAVAALVLAWPALWLRHRRRSGPRNSWASSAGSPRSGRGGTGRCGWPTASV